LSTITNIPFELDADALGRKAHVPQGGDEEKEFAALVDRAGEVGNPKALYREAYVTSRGPDTVTLDGVTFTSRALRMNLDAAERVFPFIATCGNELDTIPLAEGDILQEFWLDAIKAAVLGAARKHLIDHLTRVYALEKAATMNPGSGDEDVWPIDQQRELFSLLGDVKEQIGVELTDSFLMTPNKTVSGIRFPTEVDFKNCQLCHREECPSRSAPFDPELWELLQHD
jgi:hypothetical protein